MLTRKLYSVSDFEQISGMSKNGIHAAIRRGEIPSLRIGRRVLIPCAAVDAMLGIDPDQRDASELAAAQPVSDAR